MAKKVRLERIRVDEAEEFFRGNRINLYGQEAFIELYSRAGEDFSHVWFEELRAELLRGPDSKPLTQVTGRYCVKRVLDGKKERWEKEFRSLESGKVEVIKEGDYRPRYRRSSS